MDLEISKNSNARYLYMLLYFRATNVEYCLDNLSDFVTILGNLKFFSDTWVTVLFNYLLNSSITFNTIVSLNKSSDKKFKDLEKFDLVGTKEKLGFVIISLK